MRVFIMHYIIYKITNKINGKIYIGAHATLDLDDGYMGSGVNITKSIKKHGVANFSKEILWNFETSLEMYAKEAEIVNEEFVLRYDTYNAALGGKGNPVIVHLQDPSYRVMLSKKTKKGMTEEVRKKMKEIKTGIIHTNETKLKISESNKASYYGSAMDRTGSKLSEEHKEKIGARTRGKKLVFHPMMIRGVWFNRFEDAGTYFGVTGNAIKCWIKDTREKYADCYLL